MPAYDYRCKDCRRRFTLSYKSIAAYTAATPQCPKCHSTNLTRIIRRVQVLHSDESRLDALEGMADLDNLENADPQALGAVMRKMSSEMGEDLGPEFNEVVGRLEAGESPEAIENKMGDALDTAGDGAFDNDSF